MRTLTMALPPRAVLGAARFKAARTQNPLLLVARSISQKLQAFFKDKSRTKMLAGPNQGGKTYAGCEEATWMMLGRHPFRKVKRGPVHGWVICYSQKQSRSIQKTIYQLLPKHLIVDLDYNDTRGFVNGLIKVRCGPRPTDISVLEVKTAGQDTLGLASATLDFIWVDEPPPQEIWSELKARLLVKRGTMFLTMTPIGRPVEWLKDLVDKGKISFHRFSLCVEDCPHLTQRQINEQIEGYLAAEVPQRVYGLWEGVTPGRYLNGFTMDVVTSQAPSWDEDRPVFVGVGADYGERPGSTVYLLMLWQPDPFFPKAYFLDEYVSEDASTPEQDAVRVLDMLARNGMKAWSVDTWVGDINSAGKAYSGDSLNRVMGFFLAKTAGTREGMPPELAANHMAPVPILGADKTAGSVDWGCRILNRGFIRKDVLINPACKTLIKGCNHWKGGNTGKDGELKHGIDAGRYIATEAMGESGGYSALKFAA